MNAINYKYLLNLNSTRKIHTIAPKTPTLPKTPKTTQKVKVPKMPKVPRYTKTPKALTLPKKPKAPKLKLSLPAIFTYNARCIDKRDNRRLFTPTLLGDCFFPQSTIGIFYGTTVISRLTPKMYNQTRSLMGMSHIFNALNAQKSTRYLPLNKLNNKPYRTGKYCGNDPQIEKDNKHVFVVSDNPIDVKVGGESYNYTGMFTHSKFKSPNNFKFDQKDFNGELKQQNIRVLCIPKDDFKPVFKNELKIDISVDQGETIDWFLNIVEEGKPTVYTAKKQDKELNESKPEKIEKP